jgi:polar amino acid transport system permease protein
LQLLGDKPLPDYERPDLVPKVESGTPRMIHLDAGWMLVFAVVALIVLLVTGYPDPFRRIVVFVSDGIMVTIRLTAMAFVLIIIVGMIGGLGRTSKNRAIYGLATLYVEIIRGIPLLVQLIFIYYASPQLLSAIGEGINRSIPALAWLGDSLIGVQLNPFVAAVIGFTVCYGAYMSEIFRAGIQTIPKGQMEAARSLGMSYAQAMRYVILPQAIRAVLPPVGNEFIALLKDSSLVSAVAVADLTRRGREFMSTTLLSLETWVMVALLYLVMTLFAARVLALIERRLALPK